MNGNDYKKKEYEDKLKPFVNNVLVFENTDPDTIDVLPFFADGYPGIIFCKARNGLYLQSKNKKLSDFFFYGQTIEPIKLSVCGVYKLIIFQLYPFAARILLGIEPKDINDDCYDLMQLPDVGVAEKALKLLKSAETTSSQIAIISLFLNDLVEKSPFDPDASIILAVNLILQFKGKITIRELRNRLHLTERTLERRFVKEIGVTPKVFAKIIQFQSSLDQMSDSANSKIMDVVYENGFTDQSHFIKAFKKYTGKTPSEFQNSPAFSNV